MIIYLSFEVVTKLNYFPVKGGLSPYYIPRTTVDQKPLDYNKDCIILFGELFQLNNDSNLKNSNVSQKIEGIYLKLLDKIQGGHEILYLQSHIFITR